MEPKPDEGDIPVLGPKKKRRRMKKLLGDIRQQVEFYFGDANLRKDRFLKKEIDQSQERYVAIATISSFNRMLALTTDETLIARALATSQFVQVSEDKTHIRRTNPMITCQYDIDDLTVYVENLPRKVDHDALKKVFSACGTVAYVSLPRYKTSNDIKGFAFIEYTNPDEAKQACKLLNDPHQEKAIASGHFPTTRKGRLILPSRLVKKQETLKEKGSKHRRESSESGITKQGDAVKTTQRKAEDECDGKRRRSGVPGEGDNKTSSEVNGDGIAALVDAKGDSKAAKKTGDASMIHEEQPKKATKRKFTDTQEEEATFKKPTLKLPHGNTTVQQALRKDEVAGQRNAGTDEDDVSSREISTSDKGTCQKVEESNQIKMNKFAKEKHDGSEQTTEVTKNEKARKRHHSGDVKGGATDSLVSTTKRFKTEGTDRAKPVPVHSTEGKADDTSTKKKRKRNHKKTTHKDSESKVMSNLRVMSKKAWMELKDEYLALQKASRRGANQSGQNSQQLSQDVKSSRCKAFQRCSTDDIVDNNTTPALNANSVEPEFVSGIVLRIKSVKAFASRMQFRQELDQISPVAYIDMNNGDNTGYVRLKTAEGASMVLSTASKLTNDSSPIEMALLTGQDELQYWDKLRRDREMSKMKRKPAKKRKAGGSMGTSATQTVDKKEIVPAARKPSNKHIIFDDE